LKKPSLQNKILSISQGRGMNATAFFVSFIVSGNPHSNNLLRDAILAVRLNLIRKAYFQT
jgi:hypothetical protein